MIKQLKKGLFNTPNEGVSLNVSSNDVNIYNKDDEEKDDEDIFNIWADAMEDAIKDICEYAITINISPHKILNKKKWQFYSHQKQQEILFRMEASSLRNTPIKCIKAVFELCPTLKNVHMHCLYEIPINMGYEDHIKEWWDKRISTTDENTIIPFRHFDCRNIYDRDGWNKYILKDQKNNI